MTKKDDAALEQPAPEDAMTPEEGAPEEEGAQDWRDSFFFKKLDEDIWEAWVWAAVGLFVCAILLWVTAYLRLGYTSIYAYGVGIPLTAMFALPIIVWGMIRTILNPPVFRTSRNVGFVSLTLISVAANNPIGAAPVSTTDWTSKLEYRLPFDGEWYTMSGGPDRATNMLVTSPMLRYGYTFTVLKDGKRSTGGGKKLSDYHCFDTPILAPVDATVVEVTADIKDNDPGEYNPQSILGNYVMLEASDGAFLVLSHLKHASTTLKPGDKVTRGQVVGACGNSGLSTQPHLQFHAQNTSKRILSEGLPITFSRYNIAGQGEVKGQMPRGAGAPDDLANGQLVRFIP